MTAAVGAITGTPSPSMGEGRMGVTVPPGRAAQEIKHRPAAVDVGLRWLAVNLRRRAWPGAAITPIQTFPHRGGRLLEARGVTDLDRKSVV